MDDVAHSTTEAPDTQGANAVALDAMLHRVEEAVAREHGATAWLRNLSTISRSFIALGAACALAFAIILFAPRSDLAVYPAARLMLSAGAFGLLMAALVVLNLRPLQRPDLSTFGVLVALLALAIPFVVSLLPEVERSRALVFDDWHDCLLVGVVSGAGLMILLRALDRSNHKALVVPAAAGGIVANLALLLHCPVVTPLHLALIHAPIGLLLLLGHKSWVGARVRFDRRARAVG